MSSMFFYGTLRHVPLLELVLGRTMGPEDITEAFFDDHAVYWAEDQVFPMVLSEAGERAQGLMLRNVSASDRSRLNYYEGGFAYALKTVDVKTHLGVEKAEVYFPDPGVWTAGRRWDFLEWATSHGKLTLYAARDAMAQYGRTSPDVVRQRFPFMRARAWARIMAEQPSPTTLRTDRGKNDVVFRDLHTGFEGFFRMVDFEVSHRRFDGEMSETLHREVFVGYDAALVLPYDPVTDRVLLIEQMRNGVMLRGDPHPWVLEPIAGMVDALETPEDCVRREAQEEAGLDLTTLSLIARVYASPGYSTDFFHCYLGQCSLPEEKSWLGGLESESEDIRSHVISFERSMELLESGEINVGPTAMMLMWLARHREELRASA